MRMNTMAHKPLKKVELECMTAALRANVDEGKALLQESDTSFAGCGNLENDMVISAIKSVPYHY